MAAATHPPDQQREALDAVGIGSIALQALDPRFPNITQTRANAAFHLRGFLAEIAHQIQMRERLTDDLNQTSIIGYHLVRAMAERNSTVDLVTIGGQVAGLTWLGREISWAIQQVLAEQDSRVENQRRLQVLNDLVSAAHFELNKIHW